MENGQRRNTRRLKAPGHPSGGREKQRSLAVATVSRWRRAELKTTLRWQPRSGVAIQQREEPPLAQQWHRCSRRALQGHGGRSRVTLVHNIVRRLPGNGCDESSQLSAACAARCFVRLGGHSLHLASARASRLDQGRCGRHGGQGATALDTTQLSSGQSQAEQEHQTKEARAKGLLHFTTWRSSCHQADDDSAKKRGWTSEVAASKSWAKCPLARSVSIACLARRSLPPLPSLARLVSKSSALRSPHAASLDTKERAVWGPHGRVVVAHSETTSCCLLPCQRSGEGSQVAWRL